MRTLDLHGYSSHMIDELCDIILLAQYYQQEFNWLLNHARAQNPEANSLYIGSYVILLASTNQSFYEGTRCDSKDETATFILNEILRLRVEVKEVNALFKLATRTAEEPWCHNLNAYHLMGLKYSTPALISDRERRKALDFQRANHKTLTKMKETCVRALLRGIPQPFEFNDDMDLSDNKRTYKSIFD